MRVTTNSRNCGRHNFELHPRFRSLVGVLPPPAKPCESDHAHLLADTSAAGNSSNPFLVHQHSQPPMASTLVAHACRKPSDVPALGSDPLDPTRERLHDLLQEFAGAVVDEFAMFIEELVDMANIGFGLLHGRYAQKNE
jgi:hypothetical protein